MSSEYSEREEVIDYASHFTTRGGRLYQSSTIASPYPLPVDTPENERDQFQLASLAQVLGANYTGLFAEILAPQEAAKKVVIDLGCGTGEWVLEMANEFLHVSFFGLEIVPIVPNRNLPENVHFEIHDIGERTRWPDASVDIVHAQSIFMAVRDYSAIIHEAARILKPGGLFLSGEWKYSPSFHPGAPGAANPSEDVPGLDRFYRALNNALTARGIDVTVPSTIRQRIVNSGAFTEVQSGEIPIPLGGWKRDDAYHRIGIRNRDHLLRFIKTVRPILAASGVSRSDMTEIQGQCFSELGGVSGELGGVSGELRGVSGELGGVSGLISEYRLAYGRKI
ncbi:S-adenosyl-L-methionine-dependent methyltransferase [Gymnopus androsaceus JB14]|uniref:S-adenosyl-L-methionine-dependent methyltransferase n=1 Tax=Gymnopus androsaceus JB14 TaxID=1447944 RepID=A0A6A4GRQ6_9AGAR|nr:S-adenosyl-L-methionine-dependent methyltransferase [Gymnopus androsaceus JB14]